MNAKAVVLLLLLRFLSVGALFAAAPVKVNFTLNTTDAYGTPLTQNRYYYVYRPDNLPLTTPVPMLLVMESGPGAPADSIFTAKANQAGFVVVSCSFSGNSTGTPGSVWNNDNPRISGSEDFDYTTEVINRVRSSHNCNDAFITGASKGGHMSFAYACERPSMIKAAGPNVEFMGLTSNIPSAPVTMIVFAGTSDTNVPYTMVKDSVDAWRAMNGVLNATPVTTIEASPLKPGNVTQATWRDDNGGTSVAFVTVISGTHAWPTPSIQTGYSIADGMWAFFSQYLTRTQAAPKIVSQPVNNVQISGHPASFWVAATGDAPLSYQWQKNSGVGFVDIPGATSNWYTTPATTPGESGTTFRAIVRNASGSATSSAATLTVNAAPAGPGITATPMNQTVAAGQPARFSVTATGSSTLSYQWQKNGVDIAGATSDTLTIPASITADSGAAFRVIVTDNNGSSTSARATLTVTQPDGAPVIIANPVRERILVGQTGTFSVTARRSPASYQWQKGTFLTNMTDIPGATAATYTTPATTLADHTTLFRCTVTNAAGSATSASEMLFVTTSVKAPTEITSLLTASARVGSAFSYRITSSGGTTPLTYSATLLPAGLSINSNTGVISGTPSAAGTSKIAISASNNAGSVSATLTLTVTATPPLSSISTWRAAQFGASATIRTIAGDLADTDGDGLSNLLEYASGTDPFEPNALPWSVAVENGFLTETFIRNASAANLSWNAESSADLIHWQEADTAVLINTSNLFKVRDNVPVAGSTHRFLRMKISAP